MPHRGFSSEASCETPKVTPHEGTLTTGMKYFKVALEIAN